MKQWIWHVNNYVWKHGCIKGQNKKRSHFIEWIINDIMYWLYIYFFIELKNLITEILNTKKVIDRYLILHPLLRIFGVCTVNS